MNILITGGKSAIALKISKAFDRKKVVFADYGEIPAFVSENFQFKSLGIKNEETLAHTLLSFCLDHAIDAILPLHELEITEVAKASLLFNEFGIDLLLPAAQNIAGYFNELLESSDWVFLHKGKVVFSTAMPFIGEKNIPAGLSGVFYFSPTSLKLKLMCIKSA